MMIIGCDLHTRYQQIATVETNTGEMLECRLEHANGGGPLKPSFSLSGALRKCAVLPVPKINARNRGGGGGLGGASPNEGDGDLAISSLSESSLYLTGTPSRVDRRPTG